MRMLNIICSYLRRDDDGVEKFIATFEKVEMTQGAKTAINKVLKKKSPLTYDDKHQLLELINGCLEKRSIHSIPIKSLSSMKVNAAYTREVCIRIFIFSLISCEKFGMIAGLHGMDAFEHFSKCSGNLYYYKRKTKKGANHTT